MIKTLKESQTIRRNWIPYGRLISEILHQGGILNALKELLELLLGRSSMARLCRI